MLGWFWVFQKEALYDDDHPPFPFPRREHCMTMTTIPSLSQQKRRAFEKKALYGHDHDPLPFQEREYNFLEEG